MSLYNMLNGVKPTTFFVLPMLGKHPDEYPRFRDCFLGDADHPEYDGCIHVYTRTGGGNREGYEAQNTEMQEMPEFVADFDDDYDSTYASWVFKVPERWAADFAKFQAGKIAEFSDEYKAEMVRVFPKLKEKFEEIFEMAAQQQVAE
jgi:hypothetical protein